MGRDVRPQSVFVLKQNCSGVHMLCWALKVWVPCQLLSNIVILDCFCVALFASRATTRSHIMTTCETLFHNNINLKISETICLSHILLHRGKMRNTNAWSRLPAAHPDCPFFFLFLSQIDSLQSVVTTLYVVLISKITLVQVSKSIHWYVYKSARYHFLFPHLGWTKSRQAEQGYGDDGNADTIRL